MNKKTLFWKALPITFFCMALPIQTTHSEVQHRLVSYEDINWGDVQDINEEAVVAAVEEVPMDFLMGKFDPGTHPDFTRVTKYAAKKGFLLQKETYSAFKKMAAAARKDGVKLLIKSATRNNKQQKYIWEAKWTGKRPVGRMRNITRFIKNPVKRARKILEYSSMPGSSRHHWGTDVDLNAFSNSYFSKGKGKKVYSWLREHAASYGFCQPYSRKGPSRPTGYHEEKWHWSYMPLAKKYQQQLVMQGSDEFLYGFKGASTAKALGVVNNYILGVSPECL